MSKQKNSYKAERRTVEIRKESYVPRRIYSEVIVAALFAAGIAVIASALVAFTLALIQEAVR